MNETLRISLEDVFKYHCFSLSEYGDAHTLFFTIKGAEIMPIFLGKGIEMPADQYITHALKYAHEIDADAVLLIGEQYMVRGHKDNPDMKELLTGETKASDHPDKKDYLVLSYMSAEGETHLLFGEIKTMSGTRYVSDQKWSFKAASSVLVPWR